MPFITFNKSKIASNMYRRDMYSFFIQRGGFILPPGLAELAGEYDLESRNPSTSMFYLGMVFGVGDQKHKQLALRDAGLSAPPLGDMDFAQGHDHAVETYHQIRRGEIRYHNGTW